MDNCYLCGNAFNELDVIKHDEHIIQQAIGGALTSNNILCQSCGENLGKTIDAPFNAIFESICTRLDIRKDRGNNKKGSTKGIVSSSRDRYGNDLRGIEVFWRDSKVTPIKPCHKYTPDQSKVVIYSDKKQLKNYLNKVKNEINEKFDENLKPEIIICDDITALITYQFQLNPKSFKKGLAKIAIGFASKAGVNRDMFNLALDTVSNEIKNDITLVQFYPKSIFDEIVEKDKNHIRHYPSHTLVLFTSAANSALLICYVELFSTFQWYVILGDKYNGNPIYERYQQRVAKEEDYLFTPSRRHYKERGMILSSLGISQDRIDFAYQKQKDSPNRKSIEEIEYQMIQEEHIKQKYHVEFDREVEIGIEYASRTLLEKQSFNMIDTKMNMDLFYGRNENDEDVFNVSSYRRCYAHEGDYHDYIYSLLKYYDTEEGRNNQKEYGHKKFNMLSCFMQEKSIKEKLE